MRLSLSARIFAGFLVVLTAFGGVMGYTFFRMQRLRQELHLINKGYLRLALVLAELHTIQGNLLNTIAERSSGGGTSKFLRTQVRLARIYRVREVKMALKVTHRTRKLGYDSKRSHRFHGWLQQQLSSLGNSFRQNEPLFEQLFPSAIGVPTRTSEIGESLMRAERKLAVQIKSLRDEVRGQVKAAALQVEVDENNAIWAILFAMVVAVLVSLGVTVGSQLTLRPLKTLVASTKRIANGEYSHRASIRSSNELGVLGEEFNSMATAIEEREQRLIRSERMAAAGQVSSHITHEIRNPLSSISLNTELLQEEFESIDPEAAREARRLCQAIQREVDRLTDITEEYLRFARLPRPQLQPEEVNEIVLDLISFVSSEMADRGVTISHTLDASLPLVNADENQLRQALLNLFRNAGEAMAREGGELRITTRLTGDDEVEVEICDTGVGIEPEHLDKLFEPFFSTKESGTGLGLALTQQIIAEHNGTITASSEPGAGTTFAIRLPSAGRSAAGPGAPVDHYSLERDRAEG